LSKGDATHEELPELVKRLEKPQICSWLLSWSATGY